jgi:L-alanine-DL-glutamate epimerase-like enolase superfamily enzyme
VARPFAPQKGKGASVQITRVDVTISEALVRRQFRWRAGLPGSGTTEVAARLAIDTDEGVTGIAYASRGPIVADLVDRRLRDLLVGADPLLKEDLWERVWEVDRVEELPIYVLGLADMALWDLTAKLAGRPLYQNHVHGERDHVRP